jgi:GNAT superfamily N-acetyltransferase
MNGLTIKIAEQNDLQELLELYIHLHEDFAPEVDSRIENIWSKIINDPNHHVLLGYIDGKLVSSCVIVIIENLTRNQRPYAVIENVVTHAGYRNKGYASAVLATAKDIAVEHNCYKIMLMTGSKKESTLDFYRRAGYNSNDKTAFIQWL